MAARAALESEAAKLLGQMLFEFGRLDMNLGLCVVWFDAGAKLDSLTNKVSEYSFHKKLEEVSGQVDKKLPHGSKGRVAYEAWVERAHEARQLRNELVHGRWGVDAINNKVVNVLGLPTSEDQRVVKYTLEGLAAINDGLRQLWEDLARLRERWPL